MPEPKDPIASQDENKTPSPIRKRRPKPDIEGITVPFAEKPGGARPNLTTSERQLIAETEKTGPSVSFKPAEQKITLPKRKPGHAKWFLTLLFLVVLAVTGYELYMRYLAKPTEQTDQNADLTYQGEPFTPAEGDAPDVATSTPAGTGDTATTTPATQPVTRLKVTATPTNYLNVRQSGSLSSPIITKVNPGEVYTYTDYRQGWYKITLPNNTTGWVTEQYVEKVQ